MADVPSPPPRDVVDRAWPAPWGPAQPGAVRLATQERVPLGSITGSVQGEVERGQIDAKRAQIERALEGQGRLPPVTFVQDPRNPGGLVTLDGNHTLQAYRELGFREVPGQVYNADGTRVRVENAQFHPDRIFNADDVRVVDRFSGNPRQQWEARQAARAAAGACSVCGPAPAGAAGGDPPTNTAPADPARPADADDAFRRAQRTGGSQAGGVVYGVGGTPDNPQVYKFSPDGRYLGTVAPDRIPVATEMGVSEQMARMQNPGAPLARFVDAPDGRRYAVGGPSGILVDEGGVLRPLDAGERAQLPRSVQTQLMRRAAGPAIAMPDGVNGMGRRIAGEFLNNWVDGAQLHMAADERFNRGESAVPPSPLRR